MPQLHTSLIWVGVALFAYNILSLFDFSYCTAGVSFSTATHGSKKEREDEEFASAGNTNSSNSQHHDLAPSDWLLSVPFYVYEELAWENATFGDESVKNFSRHSSHHDTRWKHSDDYWFLEASLRHPMRTRNPDEAKLFFVPLLMNYIDLEACWGGPLCWMGRCDGELIQDAVDVLAESPYFRTYPERHIAIRSMFTAGWDWWTWEQHNSTRKSMEAIIPLLRQMNLIVLEGNKKHNNPDRLKLPSYDVGTPCNLSDTKLYDVAMIASLREEREQFHERRSMCDWLTNSSVKVSVCGTGKMCPALAQSKFGFHVAGDSWGSQRLMDTILSGTVPIFTSLEQYPIQGGDWIDWAQLSYYLPVHNYSKTAGMPRTMYSLEPDTTRSSFLRALNKILEDEEGYQRRHEAVLRHRKLFDYTTLYPFDTTMYLFQAHLFPESRRQTPHSRWSALRLPPQLFFRPGERRRRNLGDNNVTGMVSSRSRWW
jgi:hypothetical protein